MKKNELREVAARREIKEEVGLLLDKLVYLGDHYATHDGIKKSIVHCFYAQTNDWHLCVDEDEIAEARWVSRDNLPEPQSPAVPKVLRLLDEHRKRFNL